MTILLYHQVTASDPSEIHGVNVQQFAEQMRWLHAVGYQTAQLDCSAFTRPKAASLPKQTVIITFDDGYQDAYTQAFPILAEHGYIATIFLVAGLIGKASTWHRADLPRMSMLSWEEVCEMQRHGVAFGSHTLTHSDLRTAPAHAIDLELRQSRRVIEDETGNPVTSFSYPFGWENSQIRSQVRSSGYALACTYRPRYIGGPGPDVYRLQRVAVLATDTLADFQQKVRGALPGRMLWWSHLLRAQGRRFLTSVRDLAGC